MEQTLDCIIKDMLTKEQLVEFNRIYYGRDQKLLELNEDTVKKTKEDSLDIVGYSFQAEREQLRPPRSVRLCLIQRSLVLPTGRDIDEQKRAIFDKVRNLIGIAASEGVNIICLQEAWNMPFFLCTRQKSEWAEFVESSSGPSIQYLASLAKQHGIVIVSPILEEDDGAWWNTAFVIDETGCVLGKHRKNHLPCSGSFSETSYYSPGGTGHPVFETSFGKIAVNICYGRHHALNWLMFAMNGAEVVFNPSATVASFGESFWTVEARSAAAANGYFTCSINRVGTEVFDTDRGLIKREYYGSSYVSAPDGTRTPCLSRHKDGVMVVEVDLNMCRQVRDRSGLNVTSRLDLFAAELVRATVQLKM